MQYAYRPNPLSEYAQWTFFEGVFSREECERIKAMFSDGVDAQVGGGQGVEDVAIRKSKVCWLECSADTIWIYEKISEFVQSCNNARYRFSLCGMLEPFQLARYDVGDFYDYHQDFGPNEFSIRKLSISVQLDDGESYSGGELKFMGHEGTKVSSGMGDLIIFPSFNPHQVTPIIHGVRHSLVGWISGEPFK
jgi:predicted 2-oxoglutarate/Fe(II)-dependent dioxygenase YbiX